jgi:hypothetical protein
MTSIAIRVIIPVIVGAVLLFPMLRYRIRPFRRNLFRLKPAIQMPKEYVKGRERHLRNLAFGETGTIFHSTVAVDLKGNTWVEYDATLLEEIRYFSTVDVRLEKGGCVLLLRRLADNEITPFQERRIDRSSTTYLPVIALEIHSAGNSAEEP